jgi:hypothetical protein
MDSPKAPPYIQASSVPELGFQTDLPVGDAHWARMVGLADTRGNKTLKGKSVVPADSVSTPELQQLAPWWKNDIAGKFGLESVPAQAIMWGAGAPQTGVKTAIGAGKLELQAIEMAKAANRLGVSPETARDLILMGKERAGKKEGGPINMADGGSPGSLPSTFPDIKGPNAKNLRNQLVNVNAMNLSNPNYTSGLSTIQTGDIGNINAPSYANSQNVSAYFDTTQPRQITVGPMVTNLNDPMVGPHVVGHEAQHLQDETFQRGKQTRAQEMRMSGLQGTIERNFQKAIGKYPEYTSLLMGYAHNPAAPFKERLADLAGYEAMLPKGQRLVDTPFGKEVFNTPELQNYYHQSVRPMEQKMMPQNASLMDKNPVINTARNLKNMAQPKLDEFNARVNAGKSYADALYGTATGAKFKEGGHTTPAWQRKEGKNPTGGLNAAGRASYNRETGGHLKAPQPVGGPRKDSFCARMGGNPGPMKDEHGEPTRKALALKKWKC